MLRHDAPRCVSKKLLLLFVCTFPPLLASCEQTMPVEESSFLSYASDNIIDSSDTFKSEQAPRRPSDFKNQKTHTFFDIPAETDYSHVRLSLNKRSFKNDEKIMCTLSNSNPGVGFYYYSKPIIFNFTHSKVLMDLTDGEWLYCALENSKDEFSSTINVNLSLVKKRLEGGEYYIRFFVGDMEVEEKFYVKGESK